MRDYAAELGIDLDVFKKGFGSTVPQTTQVASTAEGWAAPMQTGLAATYAPPVQDTSMWDSIGNKLGDSKFMTGALGVGQLGLGLAGFLDNQKTAGLQRDVLKQQIGSNEMEIANRDKFLSGISNLKSVAG